VLGVSSSSVNVLVAFGGGIISFLSPCVLPIVPGYLSLVTGLTMGELKEGDPQRLPRIAWNTGLFVLGFTAVFVTLFLTTWSVSDVLFDNEELLTRISGALVLLMALYLAGTQLLMTPGLYREFRFHPHLERFGPFAAPVTGAAFGLGWTPCIGPVLAGLAFGKFAPALDFVKRHSRAITLISAAILAAYGLILLFDRLPLVTARLQEWLRAIGLERLVEIG